MSHKKTIKILHVVGGLDRGGIETWIMHILRNIDRDRFRMDFINHTTRNCDYEDEIRKLGCNVFRCFHHRLPYIYEKNFARAVYKKGPYDVLHSHLHYQNGYILRLANKLGIRIRIAHSHNDYSRGQDKINKYRQQYIDTMKALINCHATAGLAASQEAADSMYSAAWRTDPRWRLLYYGIDTQLFHQKVDSTMIRAELGIPPGAYVIGHVGRFAKQKNHSFLVGIAAEIFKREPKSHLLLVGEGPLRGEIEQQVKQMGLCNRVTFTGSRSDIPKLMLGAMDVFVLPSLHEGLPVVGIEAQAAGLPIVLSDVVTNELDLIKPLIKRLSLFQPATAWYDAIINARQSDTIINQKNALQVVEVSSFNIMQSISRLQGVYEQDI